MWAEFEQDNEGRLAVRGGVRVGVRPGQAIENGRRLEALVVAADVLHKASNELAAYPAADIAELLFGPDPDP